MSPIEQIDATNIPLKYLRVHYLSKVNQRDRRRPFETALSSLKHLKELHLTRSMNFATSTVTRSCPELRTLCLDLGYRPHTRFITRITENGVNLEVLIFTHSAHNPFIDFSEPEDALRIDHYEKWLILVENRRNRAPLHITHISRTLCYVLTLRHIFGDQSESEKSTQYFTSRLVTSIFFRIANSIIKLYFMYLLHLLYFAFITNEFHLRVFQTFL